MVCQRWTDKTLRARPTDYFATPDGLESRGVLPVPAASKANESRAEQTQQKGPWSRDDHGLCGWSLYCRFRAAALHVERVKSTTGPQREPCAARGQLNKSAIPRLRFREDHGRATRVTIERGIRHRA